MLLSSERYYLVEEIGSGGSSTVSCAYDRQDGRFVAVKRLQPGAPPEARQALAREAQALRYLADTPGVVGLVEFFEDKNACPNLVMELVAGRSARHLLSDDGRLYDRLSTLLELTEALGRIHAAGVVHRDVKPSNIMIGEAGLTLLDFGLATGPALPPATDNEIAGSPAFIAPETVHGTAGSVATDIYAVGVLLYAAICGHYPFRGTTWHGTMMAHLNAPIPALKHPDPELCAVFQPIVDVALSKSPADRFGCCQEMRRALGGAMLAGFFKIEVSPRPAQTAIDIQPTVPVVSAAS